MNTFQLSVVAPDKTIVDEVTDSVIAPGVNGYFGVMAGHEPFVTQLRPGGLRYKDAAGQEQLVAISGGFAETDGTHMIVLSDSAERLSDIDRDRVLRSLERAQKRLGAADSDDVDLARANAAMDRAVNRLKLLGE